MTSIHEYMDYMYFMISFQQTQYSTHKSKIFTYIHHYTNKNTPTEKKTVKSKNNLLLNFEKILSNGRNMHTRTYMKNMWVKR